MVDVEGKVTVLESTVSIYTQGNSGTSLSPDDVLAYADAQ